MTDKIPFQKQHHWGAAKYRELLPQIGGTQRKRLEWLVRSFAAQPNQAPSPPPNMTNLAAFLLFQSGAGLRQAEMPRVGMAERKALADALSKGLDLFADGEQWIVEVGHQRIDRILIRRGGVRGVDEDEPYGARSTWQIVDARAFRTGFLLVAMDLVERQQRWLARCLRGDCRRLFARKDPRQNFCSPRCSDTERKRRLRAGQ